jgi:hypothetical protein
MRTTRCGKRKWIAGRVLEGDVSIALALLEDPHRSASFGRFCCSHGSRPHADFAPNVSCGVTAVSLRDTQQWGRPHGPRAAPQLQESGGYPGAQQIHNRDLKNIFKGASIRAATAEPTFREFCPALLAKGMRPPMARLTLAREIRRHRFALRTASLSINYAPLWTNRKSHRSRASDRTMVAS